jgi:hypothetical protein
MGPVAIIYISSFIKTVSGIQKLIGGYTQTHRRIDDLISLLLFNKESRLKNVTIGLQYVVPGMDMLFNTYLPTACS